MTRILVIEDDPVLQQALGLNLKREGYEVLGAADGLTGLQMARDAQPDLVILDLMLPRLDGLSVARGIRQAGATPIIILTARDGEIDRIVGLESGADDYVIKPFSFGELAARIRAVLRRAPTRRADKLEAGDLTLDLSAGGPRCAARSYNCATKSSTYWPN